MMLEGRRSLIADRGRKGKGGEGNNHLDGNLSFPLSRLCENTRLIKSGLVVQSVDAHPHTAAISVLLCHRTGRVLCLCGDTQVFDIQ